MGGWVDVKQVKDCLQQLKTKKLSIIYFIFQNYLDGWMGGCKRQVKDCLQQLKTKNYQSFILYFRTTCAQHKTSSQYKWLLNSCTGL